jgi:hypothetical protein
MAKGPGKNEFIAQADVMTVNWDGTPLKNDIKELTRTFLAKMNEPIKEKRPEAALRY